MGDDDEFGLSSSDEAELLSLAEKTTDDGRKLGKRERSQSDAPPPRSSKSTKLSTDATSKSETLIIAEKVLQDNFVLPNFRLKQAEAITRVLDGGSAVVVFPTGGGKSLCYQVPGVAFKEMDKISNIRQGYAEQGITLVVSPLIALMKDQVDALKKRNIRAAVMDSTRSREEYLETVEAMREGRLDILYCAPERLNNEGFVATIAHVKGGVRLLAIDEAHCISEWGHAFRPDYLKVARFSREIKAERVLCLTATATPTVAADVCRAFDIPKEGLFRTPSYRPNLQLLARSFMRKDQSYPDLIKFLKQHPGPTIIYVTLQRHAEELSAKLNRSALKARHFHAGMRADEKSRLQDEFMTSSTLIMVATIAFGMGIDKADIRNVIHYDIPRSLEGYSQEIGRAGRDGKPSQCMLYLCAEDFHLRESFARGDLPAKQSISGVLGEIFSMSPSSEGPEPSIELNLFQLSKNFDIKAQVLKNIMAQLELRFSLLRETTPKYSSYQYKPLRSTVHDKNAAAEAIRKHSKNAKVWTHIDIDLASRNSHLSRAEIVGKLNDWNDRGYIQLDAKGVQNVYRVTKLFSSALANKVPTADALYKDLEVREQQDLDRIKQVQKLITGDQCLARTLSRHFGDDLPDGREKCGQCSWCETLVPVQLEQAPPAKWNDKAFAQVLQRIPERDDPRFLARVAFGISSPRVTTAKLSNDPVFGSMDDHNFMALFSAFAKVCDQ